MSDMKIGSREIWRQIATGMSLHYENHEWTMGNEKPIRKPGEECDLIVFRDPQRSSTAPEAGGKGSDGTSARSDPDDFVRPPNP
jgi:hypothetical protein